MQFLRGLFSMLYNKFCLDFVSFDAILLMARKIIFQVFLSIIFHQIRNGNTVKIFICHRIKFFPHRESFAIFTPSARICPTFQTSYWGKAPFCQAKNFTDSISPWRSAQAVSATLALNSLYKLVFLYILHNSL